MLHDDVLLEIFDFYAIEDSRILVRQRIEGWQMLAHVCRRWRSVIFQSPRRLNLRLLCTPNTHVRDTLDIWPPFPLILCDTNSIVDDEPSSVDNIIAVLEHHDRVCQIELRNLTCSKFGYIEDSAALRKPFPELTDLLLGTCGYDGSGPILPDSFLGGAAPRLQSLRLDGVALPALPRLHLSAPHLVYLDLFNIPSSGYIPPEVMATSLSALTTLESFFLHFRYPRPRPALESRRPPPPPLTRSILPSLTSIWFKGASEYLEEILARIDAPRLDELHITFFNQIIFNTPQLFQFISRRPTLRASKKGHISFHSGAIVVKFLSQTSDYDAVSVQIRSTASEWQLSSLEQVCNSSLPPASTIEDLFIIDHAPVLWRPGWQDVEYTLWLDLLRPFVAVKNLYVSKESAPHIVAALQELVGGRTAEVLPILEKIYFTGLIHLTVGMEKFFAARRLAGYPVEVHNFSSFPV